MTMRLATPFVLASLFLAGCSEDPPSGDPIAVGLITPDVWKVDGSPDYMLVWIHNLHSGSVQVRWNVTMGDGSGLPDGWILKASRESATLQPLGTKQTTSRGVTYPDWQWSLLSLQLPAGTAPADHALRIDAGPITHEFTLRINSTTTRVSKPGDNVDVNYDGRFADTDQSFDDGSFPTRLGGGQTVPGFDNGLMGLALREKATLILPPALAYGYDQTDPSYQKFNGKTLKFVVEIAAFK